MPNTLLTGVSGLLAHQRRLDIVANNLANLNTTAYKAQRGVFADSFYETLKSATSGNGVSLGGTNANQLGTGVAVAQVTRNMRQGNLEATGQPFDFAIDGSGFFVVSNGTESLYTRSGAFSLDQSGYLVDPATGFYVNRFGTLGEGNTNEVGFQIAGDSRIQIPIGANIDGQATANIELEGNLNSSALGPAPQILTSAFPFQVGGSAATPATLLNVVDTNTVDYIVGDSINISGNNPDGSTFTASLAVGPTTTLNDLLGAINGAVTDATAALDGDGNLTLTADNNGPSNLSLTLEDDPANTGFTEFLSHRMLQTQPGTSGDTFNGVFDFLICKAQTTA